MSSDADLTKILASLQETDKEDIVQEERARRQAARQSRVDADLEPMDTDEGGVSISCVWLWRGGIIVVIVHQNFS